MHEVCMVRRALVYDALVACMCMCASLHWQTAISPIQKCLLPDKVQNRYVPCTRLMSTEHVSITLNKLV